MHRSIPSTPSRFLRTLCATIIVVSTLLLFGGPLLGCSGVALRVESTTAEGLANVANIGLPIISATYEQSLTDAIRTAAIQEDASAAKDHRVSNRGPAMDAAEQVIVLQWAPVWSAWAVFRAAHDAWSSALETGIRNSDAFNQVKAAYCALSGVVPMSLRPALASIPGLTCPPIVTEGPKALPEAWRSTMPVRLSKVSPKPCQRSPKGQSEKESCQCLTRVRF